MKTRMTFEIDRAELFDMVKRMKGDTSAIGERVVCTMLAGEASFRERFGMAVYGITLVDVEVGDDRSQS